MFAPVVSRPVPTVGRGLGVLRSRGGPSFRPAPYARLAGIADDRQAGGDDEAEEHAFAVSAEEAGGFELRADALGFGDVVVEQLPFVRAPGVDVERLREEVGEIPGGRSDACALPVDDRHAGAVRCEQEVVGLQVGVDERRRGLPHLHQVVVDALRQLVAQGSFGRRQGVAEQLAERIPAAAGDRGEVVAAGGTVEAGEPVERFEAGLVPPRGVESCDLEQHELGVVDVDAPDLVD